MRQESPGDGFLRWDAGTKPKLARNWVGGGGGEDRANVGLVNEEQLGGRGAEGAELAWGSGGGGESGERGGGGAHPPSPTLSRSSSCSAGRGRDIAAASTSRPLRAAQPGDRRRSHAMRCARDWRPGGVGGGDGSGSGLLSSRTCCHHGSCASLPAPAPRDYAASGGGAAPPPQDEPIRPGTAPHVTSQPYPAPQVWGRPYSRL